MVNKLMVKMFKRWKEKNLEDRSCKGRQKSSRFTQNRTCIWTFKQTHENSHPLLKFFNISTIEGYFKIQSDEWPKTLNLRLKDGLAIKF